MYAIVGQMDVIHLRTVRRSLLFLVFGVRDSEVAVDGGCDRDGLPRMNEGSKL